MLKSRQPITAAVLFSGKQSMKGLPARCGDSQRAGRWRIIPESADLW